MNRIDESRLETDVNYRNRYVADFVGFGEGDARAIHESASHLAPLVPQLVEAVYERLFKQDATWRHFLPRPEGYEGDLAQSLEGLTQEHPMIQYRKQHLARYLATLVTKPYDDKMVAYLDMVGKIHTERAGARDVVVPLVQMNALMGFVADALNATILGLGLDREREVRTLRAFSKLLWLQNDLINRHYLPTREAASARAGARA